MSYDNPLDRAITLAVLCIFAAGFLFLLLAFWPEWVRAVAWVRRRKNGIIEFIVVFMMLAACGITLKGW